MGVVEDAVDGAANFVGPFVDKDRKHGVPAVNFDADEVVNQALSHLQAINTADLAADPNAPYDASLAGVVYGLLDLITLLGILPHLSPGVTFSQRPKSVLTALTTASLSRNISALDHVVQPLIPILEQNGSGVQPLLAQRVLPDVFSAVAELCFSPESPQEVQSRYEPTYRNIVLRMPTSRLLPILTTLLQQPLPAWLKPVISKELSSVPLRQQGIRHTIEFLSLSYLSKNSRIPSDASGLQSQIPIPLEAITQASRLLVLPPSGITQDNWLRSLAPQLLGLLDGNEGRELSRAAGQIIAGGILNKKTTGAPGTIGWELFVLPLFRTIYPKENKEMDARMNPDKFVIVQERQLRKALNRLSAIVLSYTHAGLLKRLIGPLLLPLWALLNHAKARSLLDKEWTTLPQTILSRYMAIACDAKQVDGIATNIFWDGDASWAIRPGSEGGIEIRRREGDRKGVEDVDNILSRIGTLDTRINLFVSLLGEAKISDDVAGSIFLSVTKRWLYPPRAVKTSLTDELDHDPLSALTDAKLSEALATRFQDQFARSPQHIIELMGQLIQSFTNKHKTEVQKLARLNTTSRLMLESIVKKEMDLAGSLDSEEDTADEDLLSFALSIVNTLVASPDFKQTPKLTETLNSLIPCLTYLSQQESQLPLSPMISNSVSGLLHLLNSSSVASNIPTTTGSDSLAEHRATLNTIISDLTSTEPPNRTWALKTLGKFIQNSTAFPVIDLPSLTHMLLSASLADPESYVHTAAIPVLVDMALHAPNPVIRILVDAFIDVEEQSLRLSRGKQTEEKRRELENALDFRLRVGEVLNKVCLEDQFWTMSRNDATGPYRYLGRIIEACLTLASRRGQRTKTLSTRTQLEDEERKLQEEGEAAWGGPIPNLMEVEGESPSEAAERDALLKIVQGWEATGIEEDVRVRASAASILSTVVEYRLDLLHQPKIDAVLQIVLLALTMETSESKAILRRASVLVIMGFLRGLDAALEEGKDSPVGLSMRQQEEIERIVRWVRDQDGDALVRDHAANVVEGLETLRMKKLYRIRDEGLRLGPDLGLEGNLRGLDVKPDVGGNSERRRIVEEIE